MAKTNDSTDPMDDCTVSAAAHEILERLTGSGLDLRMAGATGADRWAVSQGDARALADALEVGDVIGYLAAERLGESTMSELQALVDLEDDGSGWVVAGKVTRP